MSKRIEWLKEEIGELPCVDTVFKSDGSSYIDSAVPVMAVYDLIDQLDEPEVLSQEWISEKAVEVYADTSDAEVHVIFRMRDLQNLLVPKQEEQTDEQIARKVDQTYKDGYEKGKEHTTEKERETVGSVFVDFLIASAKLKLALSMEVEELEE